MTDAAYDLPARMIWTPRSGPRVGIATAPGPLSRGVSAARTMATGGRSWIVLVLAVAQAVMTGVVFGGGTGGLSSDTTDPTITPAGYAFVVWTIPIISCLIYAGWAFCRSDAERYRSIDWALAATMTGFSLWLWFASEGWIWATVITFAAMLGSLAVAIREAQRRPATTRTGRVLMTVTLNVYAGWTTIAVWANLAAALHADGTGLPNSQVGWQLAVLGGAALSAVIGVWSTRAEPLYLATVLWALTAVLVATEQRGAGTLEWAAGAAIAITVVTAVLRRFTLRSTRHS